MAENEVEETDEAVVSPVSGVIEVPAKKDDLEATIGFDFGVDLDEMVEKFGAAVVFSNSRSNMKIGLQSAMRRYLVAGKDCQELVTGYKPGVQMERVVDPLAVAQKAYGNMSDEEKQAFIAKLTGE